MAKCNFKRIVDCGLGANASNFDPIALTTWPNSISADELWPEDVEQARRVRDLADANDVYQDLETELECGGYKLAGNAVEVPFVGTFAGALAASELLRYLHNGQLFDKVKYRMASPLELPTAQKGSIGDTDLGFFSVSAK